MVHPPLGAKDAQDLLDIFQDLDRARGGEELMQKVLEHLERVIPSVNASFNWFADGRISYLVHPTLPPEATPRLERIMIRNWRENPLVQHFLRTDDDRALRWRDLVDEAEWRRSPLYREFYLPLGITDQLGLRIPSPPGVAAALVVNGDHPYDARDAAVLLHLGRHAITRLGTVVEHEAMRTALHGLGWSGLLVDDDGRVVGDASPSLAHLIGQDDRILGTLRDVVGDPATSPSPDTVHAVDTSRGVVSAIVARGALPPHLLFVNAGTRPDEASRSSALRGVGLSPRESEVAMLLGDGATNAMIAEQLGISIGTVKKHLERVFRTLGVSNRTAAARAIQRSTNT